MKYLKKFEVSQNTVDIKKYEYFGLEDIMGEIGIMTKIKKFFIKTGLKYNL
jgi:hypothetical protein